MKLYVDGSLQATGTCSGVSGFTGYFRFGSYRLNSWTGGNDGYFNGTIDEVKLSDTVRSAGWIATEYNNQSGPSTFFSMGSGLSGFRFAHCRLPLISIRNDWRPNYHQRIKF